MYKTKQFSTKAQYVTPLCKESQLRARRAIMTGSNGHLHYDNDPGTIVDLDGPEDGYYGDI